MIPVKSFVDFLKGLKSDPTKILVAALAGPPTPYAVGSFPYDLPNGISEQQPAMLHSCTQNSGEYADPSVRIKNWLDAFGQNGILQSICAPDFAPALTAIATAIARTTGVNCITAQVALKTDGTPDCNVVQTTPSATGPSTTVVLPLCDATRSVAPCWQLPKDAVCGLGGRFEACHDPICAAAAPSTSGNTINVSCTLYLP